MIIILTLLLIATATALILNPGALTKKLSLSPTDLPYLNNQAGYQLLLLIVAFIVLGAAYLMNSANFSAFVGIGDIAAPAGKVSWLGIGAGESWLGIGITLSVLITGGTASFIYFRLVKPGISFTLVIPYLPWVLLFSLTNSFSEEAIYRLGIIIPLFGVIDTGYLLIISAIAFGLPHLRGMPDGFIGVLMAGLLGWILARSVIETHGIFWAWGIHFLQDVVIIAGLTLVAVYQRSENSQD